MENNKKTGRTYSLLAAGIIVGMAVINILTPARTFSENENRYLARFPELTAQTFLEGEFDREFEEWATDHVAGRDFWIAGKAHLEQVFGKKENNSVYFAADGCLIEKQERPNSGQVQKNIDALLSLESLAQYNSAVCIVPTASEILREKLPPFAYKSYQNDALLQVERALAGRSITHIDTRGTLFENREAYIYYKTDHHLTTDGAYWVYKDIAAGLGINAYTQEEFERVEVDKNFLGTTWSKAMLAHAENDTILAYYPKFESDFTLYFPADDKTVEGLYAPQHLEGKDKYSYYLDGNHAVVHVRNALQNGRRLALFKDSYAHCIVPFLANHYEEIIMIDLRYYNADPVAYMQQHAVDDILVLYNGVNFQSDTNIAKLSVYTKEEPS